MLATLATATPDQTFFSVTNLVIFIVVAAIFYPLQKKLRETVSRRRRERWAQEDQLAGRERDDSDHPPTEPQP
ncbi:hypothetical protein GCM10009868_14800 [Terrabacter aerolatus]|uniref:Uncharacterized protein n=1 Tax=Terrabacter aerolatus TaxID=422442 RepID=A0A512D6T7_9MICO|nr:hypothetical protein [Terrabacter aerolatus]GEO32194.1 hypothetical protein TAE01_40040 [Terrabacter aerolatus]